MGMFSSEVTWYTMSMEKHLYVYENDQQHIVLWIPHTIKLDRKGPYEYWRSFSNPNRNIIFK